MSLGQPKIDLAVLYKLQQHAEANGEAILPEDVAQLFAIPLPMRRIELALKELEANGHVDREYHPHYGEVGLWQISRSGIAKVDQAIGVSTSFIGRLHRNGDDWLTSEEAEKAVLKKVGSKKKLEISSGFESDELSQLADEGTYVFPVPPKPKPEPQRPDLGGITINNQISPAFSNSISSGDPEASRLAKSGTRASWLNLWVAILIGVAAIGIALWTSGKI